MDNVPHINESAFEYYNKKAIRKYQLALKKFKEISDNYINFLAEPFKAAVKIGTEGSLSHHYQIEEGNRYVYLGGPVLVVDEINALSYYCDVIYCEDSGFTFRAEEPDNDRVFPYKELNPEEKLQAIYSIQDAILNLETINHEP